ncbi:hypothetical protein BHAP_1279 [Bifidobacterium hapali]|uniref:Uncharacterized protein n=2 Tax=Bifidobacterium hapali TaxID=1630172 RepID=A0A261FY69_9BIFI|nr:hypothetical protein BHAP_1279 [Bifidobacterium hapali]
MSNQHDFSSNSSHSPIDDALQKTATTDITTPDRPVSRRPISVRTIQLLAASFAIPLLFDRLILGGLPYTYGYPDRMNLLFAMFWLVCVTITTALHWRIARMRPLVWYITAAIVALACWMVIHGGGIYTDNLEYGLLTGIIAIPSLLMLHVQLVNGRYNIHHPFGIALRWLTGWVIQPFINLNTFAHCTADIAHISIQDQRRPVIRKIGIALLITIPVLMVITALLMNADMVFSYAITRIIGDINLTSFIMHALLVLLTFPLMFSLLEQQDRTTGSIAALYKRSVTVKPDALIMSIMLGALLVVYAFFCAVQFTFLFAQEGLPGGLTYAEYARSGFFQLLLIAAVNLMLFGIVLTYVQRTRMLTIMLIGLIAATGVMLASAATRLGLYIGAYGLTWLRFTSMSFIALLAVILVLCLVRMGVTHMPLITVCFILAVAWYIALGYCNVASIVTNYNLMHGFDMA